MSENWNDFLGNVDRLKASSAQPANGAPTTPRILSTANGHTVADRRGYAEAALRRESEAVMYAAEGARNDTLNRAAFSLASLVTGGYLGEAEVRDTLTQAAINAGLSYAEIAATLASGERGSATKVGARVLPERPAEDVSVRAIATVSHPAQTAAQTIEITEAEQRDLHEIAVGRKAYELQILDEARALWARQRAAAMGQQPPALVSMADMLAVPDEPARYRVTDLLPIGGRALLAAQYKAGKTSLVANLLRSLVDGDPFLGRFPTDPVGRVVLLDTELDERMLRRWLRDQNIRNTDAIAVLSLRGRLSTFAITDDRTRAQWAATIAGADFIVLDCLRPCLDALGLSEHTDAGVFLAAFDALCREAGAGEATVVHHMGHSQERSRGDSRLLDWPDVLWKIVRDTDDEGNAVESVDRYFSAMGRDVNVAEGLLDWTEATRSLMFVEGSRTDKKARSTAEDIVEILRIEADGLTRNQLVTRLQREYGTGRNIARTAIQTAVADGVLVVVTGPRNSHVHVLNPSRRVG